MKIIKKGKLPEERIWRSKCYHCHSEIEATQQEIKSRHNDQRDGEYGFAECPVCSRQITFYPVENKNGHYS